MSSCTVFDTQSFVSRMIHGGFTELQAWALAREFIVLHYIKQADRPDIAEIGGGRDADALRQETNAEIARIGERIAALKAS